MIYDIDNIYIGKICILNCYRLTTLSFYSAFYKKYNKKTRKNEYHLINRGKRTDLTTKFMHNQEFDSIYDWNFFFKEGENYYFIDKLIKLKDAISIEPLSHVLDVFQIHNCLSYVNKIEKQKIKRK